MQYPQSYFVSRVEFSVLLVSALGLTAIQALMGWVGSFWLGMAGIALYEIGFLLDMGLTYVTFSHFKQEFDRRGLSAYFPGHEGNQFVPPHPTLKQLVFSVPTLVFLLTLPAAGLLPAFGVVKGIGHLKRATKHLTAQREMRVFLNSGEPMPGRVSG